MRRVTSKESDAYSAEKIYLVGVQRKRYTYRKTLKSIYLPRTMHRTVADFMWIQNLNPLAQSAYTTVQLSYRRDPVPRDRERRFQDLRETLNAFLEESRPEWAPLTFFGPALPELRMLSIVGTGSNPKSLRDPRRVKISRLPALHHNQSSAHGFEIQCDCVRRTHARLPYMPQIYTKRRMRACPEHSEIST